MGKSNHQTHKSGFKDEPFKKKKNHQLKPMKNDKYKVSASSMNYKDKDE